ncbi:MAG: pro-sigmaK processing inhibitor BofA family protein [Clostridiales bacterium]|nr:pro-sigmaK processing inhibitor BofA family protein [Clostridiales bacterium]
MSTFYKAICLSFLSLSALVVLTAMVRSRSFFKTLFLSVIQGTAAIFAVNAAGLLTGVTMPVNWYTLGFGAVFGAPGVISMLISEIILHP